MEKDIFVIAYGNNMVIMAGDDEAKVLGFDTEKEAQAEIDYDPDFYEGCYVDDIENHYAICGKYEVEY